MKDVEVETKCRCTFLKLTGMGEKQTWLRENMRLTKECVCVCVCVCVLFFLNIGKTLACLGAGKSHWTRRVKGENGWNEVSEDEYGRKRKALSLCCM